MPVAPVARALAPLPSVPPTASPVGWSGATAFRVTCAAAGPTVMAGGVPSSYWTSVVPVAGAPVRAVVLGHRPIANSWVPVDPVVGGAVGAVVIQFRTMSHSWALVGLVGVVHPTLAVSDVRLGVGPADGGRGSVVRFPKVDHQAHDERQALQLLPGTLSRQYPGHIHREAIVRQLFPEAAGAGDHCCRRLGSQILVWPVRHASDTPLQEVVVSGPPGPRVDGDLAGGVLCRISGKNCGGGLRRSMSQG